MKTTFLKPKGKSPPKNKQILFMNPLNLKNMKTIRTIILATALLFSLSTQAQITKGNWMVGGSGYFNTSNVKNSNGEVLQSINSVLIQPNVGYFLFDNFASGLSLSYGFNKTDGGFSNSGFGIGPYVRYYFLKPESLVNILIEPNYYYGKDFDKTDFTSSYGLKVGPVIYFNSSVCLELLAKYEHIFYSYDSFTTDSFQIGLGLQIHLKK